MYFSRLPRSQTLYSSSSSFHKRILSTEFVDGTKQWTPSIINQALWHQIRCSKESIPSSVLKKERRKTFHHLGCFSQLKLWAAVCVLSFFFFFYVTTIPRRSTAGEEDWSPPPSSLGGRMETSVSIKKKSRGENNNGLLYAILFSFNSWLFGQKVSKCHREENTQLIDQSALPWPSLCRDPKSQHTNNAYA